MSVKRYFATTDTSITNAFQSNLKIRGTGSNMGASDVNEIFSIIGQVSTSSIEVSRMLMNFPVSQITTDRNNSKIPASGSVNFVLNLYNAPHGETLPRQFTLIVSPLSRSFEEGFGLDNENYTDITRDGTGANWVNAASGTRWSNVGGDYLTGTYSAFFDQGKENLQLDITPLVENWLSNAISSNGIGIALTSSQESGSQSYYTKRFFTRTTEYFFKRPTIEARWDSSTKDDRQRFFVSSSLLSSTDNNHTIYLYNYVAGALKNISSIGTGPIYLQVYTSASNGTLLTTTPTFVTGGWVSTGIYSASFALSTTASVVYDIWTSGSNVYHTGTLLPQTFDALDNHIVSRKYVVAIPNMKAIYSNNEQTRFVLYTRLKDWSPNLYSIASQAIPNIIIDNAYYKLLRVYDNSVIVDYGTGSNYTKLSYDSNGNFWDFDMSQLEPGSTYGWKIGFLLENNFEEQDGFFKFKVIDT